MEKTQEFPTEIVELPSKGKLYPEDSPLREGKVEMKYMTAKEEDILTNQSYISSGIVVEKLIQALLVDKSIDYSELLVGDQNALLIASRVVGYGKDYEVPYGGTTYTVDLTKLPEVKLHEDVEKAEKNEFTFTTPTTGHELVFKLLTQADEKKIDSEIKGLAKIRKDNSPIASTTMKYTLLAVNGDRERKTVREFVDSPNFLARDARALRKYIRDIQPDIELKFFPEEGPEGGVDIPIGANFLWPDAGI